MQDSKIYDKNSSYRNLYREEKNCHQTSKNYIFRLSHLSLLLSAKFTANFIYYSVYIGIFHMKFSITGQERSDPIIQVIA
jgi:hypothetical protein